ncbi:MAG: hypothetical protein RSE20_10775 [Eubacterium sp.]
MRIKTEFIGLEALQQHIIEMGSETLLNKVNRTIVEAGQQEGIKRSKPNMPKAADHSKSGVKRGGMRATPSGISKENIPMNKIKKDGLYMTGDIGWLPDDTSEHFYVKFPIYGTNFGIDEHPVFEKAEPEVKSFITRMAEAEYKKVLEDAFK